MEKELWEWKDMDQDSIETGSSLQSSVTELFFQGSCSVAAWHTRLQTNHARQALVSFDGTYEKVLALDPFGRWEKSGPITWLHMIKPGTRSI